MGRSFCGFELLTMILIIITTLLVLLSAQRTHILSVDDLMNAVGSFNFHGLQQPQMYEENEQGRENKVKKISGLDENEEKQAFIVEKVRSLLGLRSFHARKPSNGDSQFLPPSPSPSPAPAPSPVLHLHPHSHHKQHHFHRNLPPKKTHGGDRDRAKRILVAVLVSVGVAALVGAFVSIFFCWKFTNHRKKPKRTMPLCSSKNKEAKVSSSNSGLDRFYLDALGEDIEQHSSSLKRLECDNVSCSFTKELCLFMMMWKNQ